nr:hypothetical protein [Tanacetum cinerariifolium]
MVEMFCQFVLKKREEKRIEEEQAAKAQTWKFPVCYDDDDDEESSNPLEDNIIPELPSPVLRTLSQPQVSPRGCDVLAGFTTFSNVLFDDDNDFDSSDDQSLSDEDVREKIYSNPLFDEEIIPMEIDQRSFNAESDLIESMPNHDSSIIISSKIDSLFDEFVGELTLLKSFPPGIDEIDCHLEKEIQLLDNYSLSLPTNKSYHFDIPLPYRPSAKPPDGNTGTLNIKMMGDVDDQKPSAQCPMIINGKNISSFGCSTFPFLPP